MDRPRDPAPGTSGTSLVARAARVGVVAWAVVGVAIVAYLIVRYLLYPIRIIFPPLVVALILVYLLNPVVSALERRGVRRLWGTLLTYVVFLSAVGALLSYLIPVISHQVADFSRSVPGLLQRAQNAVVRFAHRLGLHVKGSELFSTFHKKGSVSLFIGRVSSLTKQAAHLALILLLGPILAFYFLLDVPKLSRSFRSAIPGRRRGEVQSLGVRLNSAIGGYFRGQLLVALFVAVFSMLGLWIVGLPYWAVVGLITGLFSLVPLIGPFIGAIPALFVAFTSTKPAGGFLIHPRPGWPLAVAASVVLLIVQQVDSHLISPRAVRRSVRLHPLTVLLSLLAAGSVLGLWGMLLVIPVVASAKILVMHYWDTRMVWPPNEPQAKEAAAGATTPEPAAAEPSASSEPVPAESPTPPRAPAAANGREAAWTGWWARFREAIPGRRDRSPTPGRKSG